MQHLLSDINALGSYQEVWSRVRRDIHRHPELGFEEHRTARIVAERLAAWGYEVSSGIGRTGVVGTMREGTGSKSIGLRADMDALPILEQATHTHASVVPGCMHACGHDGHTAMLLGAAEYIAATRAFDGTLRLYFQPAEERGSDGGAKAMLSDGLFDRFPCDVVYAMHTHPGLPVGMLLTRPGPFMSAFDKIVVRVQGKGGHAARPHLAVDPVVAVASIVMALQTVVSRNIDPLASAVLTVGVINAGTASNVIPTSAMLEISIRSFSTAARQALCERIEAIAVLQARSYGAQAEVQVLPGCPVLVNGLEQTQFAVDVARELLGIDAVDANANLIMASEDFGFMLEQRPGCLLRIGNGLASPMVHHPSYDFDDRSLPVGAGFWIRLVQRYLS
ncbi:MAG: M20 aminoacylase family protein [Burkholderiaceae bacterium]|nr:M20 aminoacylase family protein [Burkholderiaceae bacterium]